MFAFIKKTEKSSYFPPKDQSSSLLGIRCKSTQNANLQEASGSGESKGERLAADVKRARVGLLRADRKRVPGPGSGASGGHSEKRVGAQRHGRVRRVVQVKESETQRWQTNHE